jgi:uncharacterized protein YecT (DUF1311 family)
MNHRRSDIAATCLIALLMWSSTTLADECDESGSWSTIRACRLNGQDSQVNAAYKHLLKKLQDTNADAAKRLTVSQASWSKFMGDTCDFQAAFQSDAIPGDVIYNCAVDFNKSRIRILKDWAAQVDTAKS